jgi:hypothetical protein
MISAPKDNLFGIALPHRPAKCTDDKANENFNYLYRAFANLQAVTAAASVPVGTVIQFAGTSLPQNYLACPTTATNISRTTYARLFEAIGTTWGAGDGSTTFGMPYFTAVTGIQYAVKYQ